MPTRKDRIIFTDGRRGIQYTDEDGRLTGVLVTHDEDGQRCSIIYDRHSDLWGGVFSLTDLRGEWRLAPQEKD